MPPQIKQAKLREEFIKEFPHAFDHEDQYNLNRDEVIDWWLAKCSQAKLETLEAIIKEVEELINYEKQEDADYWVGRREGLRELVTTLQAQKELIENNK